MSAVRHVVFGTGAVGLATFDALRRRGETVRLVNRTGTARVPDDVEVVGGDAADPAFTTAVAQGAEVVHQTLKPPYHQWAQRLPALQSAVAVAAQATGARLVSMENVYLYGRPAGRPLTEDRGHDAHMRRHRRRLRGGPLLAGPGAAAGGGRAASAAAPRPAGQQRRWLLEPPSPHGGRLRAHLRREPPFALPAHPPAAGPATCRLRGRIVDVASAAHATGRIDFDDLHGARRWSGARACSQSKLTSVLFTYELARRLDGTGVTANAVHPGVVSTAFGAEDPGRAQRLLVPLVRPFMRNPGQGAATSVHCASAPELQSVSGAYFASGRRARSSGRSLDEAVAARLWDVSASSSACTLPLQGQSPSRRPWGAQ